MECPKDDLMMILLYFKNPLMFSPDEQPDRDLYGDTIALIEKHCTDDNPRPEFRAHVLNCSERCLTEYRNFINFYSNNVVNLFYSLSPKGIKSSHEAHSQMIFAEKERLNRETLNLPLELIL